MCSPSNAQEARPAAELSVCDVLRNPTQYGKVISARGVYSVGAHGSYVRGEGCGRFLENDTNFKWPPVIFISLSQRQMESRGRDVMSIVRAMDELSAAIQREVKRKGPEARVARVWLTCVGLFETRDDIEHRPGDGFGPLNTAPGQLYIDTVKDIVVEFEE